jgi:hypothetical protein
VAVPSTIRRYAAAGAAVVLLLAAAAIAAYWVGLSAKRQPESVEPGPQAAGGATEGGVPARAVDPASMEQVDEPTRYPFEFATHPDAGPQPADFEPEFEAALASALAAKGSGDIDRACIVWGRLVRFVLRGCSEEERGIVLLNVADVCSRSSIGKHPHNLRLAHEALERYALAHGRVVDELDHLLGTYPHLKGQRSNLAYLDQHPEGTEVILDGEQICSEPCTVAVPVDGNVHELRFERDGATAVLQWKPATPDAAIPPLPDLRTLGK